MGYVMCHAACFACNRPFMFNPHRVPSVRHEGERQPVCRECVEIANPIREKNGLPPSAIHPDAYEPLNEEEL